MFRLPDRMKQYSLHIGAPSHSAVLFTIDDKMSLFECALKLWIDKLFRVHISVFDSKTNITPWNIIFSQVTTICFELKMETYFAKEVKTHIHTKSLKTDN